MDLKGNRITVGELLAHPGARAVFEAKLPEALRHPLLGAARTVTLEQLLALAGGYLPRKKIDEIMEGLRRA